SMQSSSLWTAITMLTAGVTGALRTGGAGQRRARVTTSIGEAREGEGVRRAARPNGASAGGDAGPPLTARPPRHPAPAPPAGAGAAAAAHRSPRRARDGRAG